MYRKTQKEMIAMTPEISKLRKELGARLSWNCGGLVKRIIHDDYVIHYSDFKRIANDYIAEQYLLGRR